MIFSGARSGWIAPQNRRLIATTSVSISSMQLDLFEHSRDVVLRNVAIDVLRKRDAAACARAVIALGAEDGFGRRYLTFRSFVEGVEQGNMKTLKVADVSGDDGQFVLKCAGCDHGVLINHVRLSVHQFCPQTKGCGIHG